MKCMYSYVFWIKLSALWYGRAVSYHDIAALLDSAEGNRKMRRKTFCGLKALWIKYWSKVTISTVIHYTMLQYVCCNGLLWWVVGEMVLLLRGSLAAVLLGWLLLSQMLVPVGEINDILATLLSAGILRDRDTGDALQRLYTINPVCVCLLSGEQCVCVGGCRCVCLHVMAW